MIKSSSFKTILTIILLSILVFCAVFYFLYKDIKTKNEHISVLENKLSLQHDTQEYILSTEKIVENLGSDITRINDSIIASGGDVEFIENLESIARSYGLTMDISSLTFEEDSMIGEPTITVFKIKAKTQGNWVGTYTFLAQLEALPMKIKIDRFSFLTSVDQSSGEKNQIKSPNLWQSSFEIRVLKYK